MELLPTFLLAHLLADFPLQNNAIAAAKGRSLPTLFLHVMIHMFVLWALLGFAVDAGTIVLALGITHCIVDWLKPRLCSRDTVQSFLLDQLAHLSTILLIVNTAQPGYRSRDYLATPLLYPSLGISIVLAAMVFLWVWINTLQEKVIQQNSYLRWGRARLLEIEQYTGRGLLCVLVVSLLWMH